MVSEEKLTAMINLLDDPDQKIYQQVSQEILEMGHSAVPALENAWENAFNSSFQGRIEQVMQQIQFAEAFNALKNWRETSDHNLLDAAVIIAGYQYADLDKNFIYDFVDQLIQDVWIEMNANYTAMEKVGILNKVFFEIYGFKGNKKEFHSPKNAYINNVLEARKGNPISLSILYLEIANRLKLPIYGVNLAEHFILAYTEIPINFLKETTKKNILFYINPFNGGTLFQAKEIEHFLAQLKIEDQEKFYLPCDKITVVNRLLNNLIFCYNKLENKIKVEEIINLKKALN